MISVAQHHQNGIVVFCLQALEDRIRKDLELGRLHTPLAQTMVHLIPHVPLQLLDDLLETISKILYATPQHVKLELCRDVFNVIADNFDYSRKSKCLKWYLDVKADLGIIDVGS